MRDNIVDYSVMHTMLLLIFISSNCMKILQQKMKGKTSNKIT